MAGTKCPGTRWQTMTRPPASTRWAVFSPATQREALGPSTARATAPASATSPHLHHLHQLSCLLLALSCCCCCWLVGCLCAVCDSFGFANCTTLQLSTIGKAAFSKRKARAAFSQERTCAHKQKNNKGFLSHPFFCFVLFQALLRLTIASRDGEGKELSKGKAKGSKQRPQGAKKDQRGSRCREQRSCSKHQGCLPLPFHLVLLSQVTLSHKYLLLLSFLKPPASLLTVLCFFANLGAVAQYDVYDEDNNIDFSKIRPVDGDESDAEYAVNSDDDEEIDSDAVRFFFSISFLISTTSAAFPFFLFWGILSQLKLLHSHFITHTLFSSSLPHSFIHSFIHAMCN